MDMEQHGVLDDQRDQAGQQVVPGHRDDDDGARRLFLDAGRVLMLWGWAVLIAAATSAAGRKNDDDDGRPGTSSSAAVHVLLAFALWLLGVSLVALVHVERRFPRAARVGAAAANAVVDFVPPWN